ncbi:alpha-2-macroglobulin family protein [Indioceanicola profundi]|uniref:alpha-2-macroglobulin family protein n=1 Tax=Indioceanicola profundi TaxID=2220096 RepID=UPI0013C40B53|nr:MG2 domain-containing protein [Indioceanicola profundi]
MPRISAAVLFATLSLALPGQGLAQGSPPPDQGSGGNPTPPAAAVPPPGASPVDALPESALPQPFGLAKVDISAEREKPQACFTFNRPLPRPGKRQPDLKRFLTVEPAAEFSVTVRDRDLCLEGLAHGQRYTVTLAAGLPSVVGEETLGEPVTRELAVPDRRPALSFRGQGYILPRIGGEGLPLRSVNIDRARLQVIRIADRQLVEQIYYGRINQTLTDFDVGIMLEEKGEVVWKGEIATGGEKNRTQVTPFPIDAVLGSLQPGVYIAVAEDAALPQVAWDQRATQWFVVSDVGLTSFRAANGLFVFARSLENAQPLPGVELRLVSRDNAELGRAVTGPDGLARFSTDGMATTGPKAPQALFAAAPQGDFSLLDFGAPAVELAQRSGGGRTLPGALDVFLSTERAAYRPGDTIHVVGLLRDANAVAAPGRELFVRLQRPDGLELFSTKLNDQGLGGFAGAFTLPETAPEGKWLLTARAEAGGPVIGRTEITVGEVAPARLTLSLTADRPRIAADGKAVVRVDGRYLHGAAASRLPGEMRLRLREAENPWPGLEGYRFGLVQEPFKGEERPLPGFTTTADGTARVPVELGDLPRTSQPLEAVITATLHDIGGRAVQRELVLPVDHQAFALGIKPNFAGDAVPEGATVGFDVVAVAPDGRRMERPDLSWELFEEEYEYDWFEADGRWDYRANVRDRRLTGGSIDAAADEPALIEEQVKAGRYRLEVFDPATGIASSVRFSAGWWVSAKFGETPDAVEVAVMDSIHQPGGTARVFVRPPYQATVLVTVADRAVRHTTTQEVGPEGAFLDVPVAADLTSGAYVLATAYAPADPQRRAAPRRAIGIGWIGLDTAPRRLDVQLQPPETARPGEPVTIPVTIAGLAEGETAHLVVRAVDERLLAAEGRRHRSDPAAWFHGKRDLSVELRDVYGPLPVQEAASRPAPGPAAGLDRPASRTEEPPTASIQSQVLTAGPDGRAEVTLPLPAAEARLGLEVVAWTADRVGDAAGALNVREDVQLTAELPEMIAVGDVAQIALALENSAGPRGAYSMLLEVEGPFALEGEPKVEFRSIPRGRRVEAMRSLTATGDGMGRLRITVEGPEGYRSVREIELSARPSFALEASRQVAVLAPGAAFEPAPAADGRRVLVAGLWSDLDLPAQILTGDKPVAASTEQLASRLLPLVEAPNLVRTLTGMEERAFRAQAQDLVDRLAARQRADGGFAPWSVDGPTDPWLTPFALDVLTRAREAGYRVPDAGYRRGLDWLVRTIGNSWVHQAELPARAYALYTAARAKAIDAAPVNYFFDTYFAKLPNRLAQAQVAAAFAVLGDTDRARTVIGQITAERQEGGRAGDYGTELRDRAAALSLIAASGADPDRLGAQASQLAGMLKPPARTSLQERAWLVAAGAQLAGRGGAYSLSVDGKAEQREGLTVLSFAPGEPLPPVMNAADRTLTVSLTALSTPLAPPPAVAEGFELSRTLFNTRGQQVDLAAVKPGDLLVVVLKGKALTLLDGPVLVADPLPAGMAIEEVRLAGPAQPGGLSWLGDLTTATYAEFRPEAFVAALEREQATEFSLAYLVRAAGEGRFAWPGATVQDVVDATSFARTEPAEVTIVDLPTAPKPANKPRPPAAAAAPASALPPEPAAPPAAAPTEQPAPAANMPATEAGGPGRT